MNTRLKKIMKIAATGLFVVALAINIGVTLNDPFSTVSNQALADTSSGGSGTGNGSDTGYFGQKKKAVQIICPESAWATVTSTNTQGGTIGYNGAGSLSVSAPTGASASMSYNGGNGSYGGNTTTTTTQKVPTFWQDCYTVDYESKCSILSCRVL